MTDTVLQNVRPWASQATDLVVRDGRLVDGPPDAGADMIDGGGRIALPGLVDAHGHIDKTLLGTGWHSHRGGPTVLDRIRNERNVLAEMNLSPAVQAARVIDRMAARGTTHCRTHVDIAPDSGLSCFHGVMAARERTADRMDVQVVAFPQTGVMIAPGTLDLLDRACAEGAEVVGGLDPIGIDRDPVGQFDGLFAIAERRGVEIDIHLHDTGEVGALTIDMVHERTRALGMKGKVALSHVFCLGSVTEPRLADLTEKLVDQDIAVMTHGPSGATPFPPVRRLHDAGVRLFAGSDGIRDSWGPLNSGDMLQRAFIVAYRNGFRHDADIELCLHMATDGAAQVVGAKDYGLAPGCRADLLLVDAETLAEAVCEHPRRALVMKGGKVIARDGVLEVAAAG
jgi:cytosine deaminase